MRKCILALTLVLCVAGVASAVSVLLTDAEITATASSRLGSTNDAWETVGRTGVSVVGGVDVHNNSYIDMWVTANYDGGNWIAWEFDKAYNITTVNVWNYNQPGYQGRGMRHIKIETSLNGSTWTTLSADTELKSARGDNNMVAGNSLSFGDVSAKYVRFTAHTLVGSISGGDYSSLSGNWGQDIARVGLSEVQFIATPEPATLALLGFGALSLIRRKK